MCQLAGEACDGIRPHPITTRKFITEVMLPKAALGAKRAGRRLEQLEVAISPLVAVGEDDAELGERVRDVRARIVLEAANAPTTPAADELLAARGVTVLPDIWVNAGGVTAVGAGADRDSANRPAILSAGGERIIKKT